MCRHYRKPAWLPSIQVIFKRTGMKKCQLHAKQIVLVLIKKIIGHPTIDSYSYGSNTACFTGQRRIGEWSWNTKPGEQPFQGRLGSYIMISMKWAGNITLLLEAVDTPIRKVIIKAIVFLTRGRQFSSGPPSLPRNGRAAMQMLRLHCWCCSAGRHRYLPAQSLRATILPRQQLL